MYNHNHQGNGEYMAQLDIKKDIFSGWTCIKETGSIQSLKNYARTKVSDEASFRIFDDGLLLLVGVVRSGRLSWGEGIKKPREECPLGTTEEIVNCACGSKVKPIKYRIESCHYIIECEKEDCCAQSISTDSVKAIQNWNNMSVK